MDRMAKSSTSIWFDLLYATGVSEAGLHGDAFDPSKGLQLHHIPVASLVVRDVYLGDFDKSVGFDGPVGFWEWSPRCLSEGICTYPLPEEWLGTVHGGWHWELERDKFRRPFLALDKDVPFGKKIGALNGFRVSDFRGYDPRNPKKVDWKFHTAQNMWTILDEKFHLFGQWQLMKLI